ncbi:MAG: amino acid adenylation domain-containing protein, partial [Williamsia herbipolensis]|nr:amino acid adenylation domain-containing protein [Williamsia herbipolensis]
APVAEKAADDHERLVAGVLADVLSLDEIDVGADFFVSGGNSLSATRVAARLSDTFGVRVGVRDLFETSTARGLAARIRAADGGVTLPPITPQTRPEHIPLTIAQQRIWFLHRFDPTSTAYVIPLVVRVPGPLDPSVVRAAVIDVLTRHEVLRTVFPEHAGRATQRVLPVGDAATALTVDVADTPADEAIPAFLARPMDLLREMPVRVLLVPGGRPDEAGVLALALHHIAVDGESMRPLLTDLATAWAARSAGHAPDLPPLPLQVADVALWQHTVLGSVEDPTTPLGSQVAHRVERLRGLPDLLPLPTDRPRPLRASGAGDRVRFTVPAALAQRVRAAARRHAATEFMVVHAALAVLLARLSATDDIAVATPTAGRGQAGLDDLVGMFVNTLVLRVAVTPELTVDQLLAAVREADLDAVAHADAPFEHLVEHLAPGRSESHAPLAQVMLSLDQSSGPAGPDAPGGAVGIEVLDPGTPAARVDLEVTVSSAPTPDGDWPGEIVYATDLFDPDTVETIAARLVRVLAAITDGAGGRAVGDIDLLDGADRAAIAAADHGPTVPRPTTTLADLLLTRYASDPDAVAVTDDDGPITMRAFASRVHGLARRLVDEGIGPEDAVAVVMNRSVDLVVAIHAVVVAGGQYVPLDPTAPRDRVADILATASVSLVLTTASDRPDTALPVVLVDPDRDGGNGSAQNGSAPTPPFTGADRRAPLHPTNAVYTIFTSGSTGRPKGVTVSHAAVLNRLAWGSETYPLGAGDGVVLKTPATFDVSVPELFAPTLAGARIVVARADGHTDPAYLAQLLARTRAATVHFVPSMLAVFLEVVDDATLARLASLRHLFVSGEALPPALAAQVRTRLPGVGLHDLFGPTEAAVEVTHQTLVDVGDVVPIGRPVDNTVTRVLDARLHPVPTGVPGELYLGGVQLARGYAARGDLTADRFVADPQGAPGARLYRTGDLVRRNRDGALEYLGRTDFQVKLRGQRIELGEVESVLLRATGVVHAAATVAETAGGAQHLVGYVAGTDIDLDAVGATARDALPEYMVPTRWVVLDDVVLSTAGKLDRRALPPLRDDTRGDALVAPATSDERVVAEIVAAVLGRPAVSVTESFFALGGDSIMSIRLVSLLRAAGYTVTPRMVFDHRTVRAITAAAQAHAVPPLAEYPGGAVGPVTPTPTLRWMADLVPDDDPDAIRDFSQAMVLSLPADDGVDPTAVLRAVVAHHPMLTASLVPVDAIRTGDDLPWRVVAGAGDPTGVVIRVHDRVAEMSLSTAIPRAHARALADLDPARGAVVGATLVPVGDGPDRLVIAIHHIAVDAVSWQIIGTDLGVAWSQIRAGRPVALAEPGTSARRWAGVLAELDREDPVPWAAATAPGAIGTGAGPERAMDPVRDRQSTVTTTRTTVPTEIAETVLTDVATAYGTGVDTVLVATLAHALVDVLGRRDPADIDENRVAVLTETHGREESLAAGADLSGTVGWFTGLVPVAVSVGRDVTATVKAVKDTRARMPRRGLGFGALRWAPGSTLTTPAIALNYFGAAGGVGGEHDGRAPDVPVSDVTAPGLPATVRGTVIATAALTATVTTAATPGGRVMDLEMAWPAALLETDDARAVADRWRHHLATVASYVAAVGDPGPSETDLGGTGLTQSEIDLLLRDHPGATLWPTTPLQAGMLVESEAALSGVDDAPDVYVVQTVLTLGPSADPVRMCAAADALVARHRVLRSGFVRSASGRPVVVVAETARAGWAQDDLTDLPGDAASRVAALADIDRVTPFDLGSPALLRFRWISHVLADGEIGASFVITAHHLVLDGWSAPLVVAELLAGHDDLRSLDGEPENDFGAYLAFLADADTDAARSAWAEELAVLEEPTLVAPDLRAPHPSAPRTREWVVDTDLTAALTATGRRLGTTTNTLVQAAWAILLSGMTGIEQVVFGETVSGRPPELPGADTMVGLFINTIPATVAVRDEATVADVATDLQWSKTRMLDHQHLGLADIAAAAGGGPLFDTVTVFESFPVDTETLAAADGLDIRGVVSTDATHYPLTLVTVPAADRLVIRLRHLPELVDDDRAAAVLDTLRRVLSVVGHSPSISVSAISARGAEAFDNRPVSRARASMAPVERPVEHTDPVGGLEEFVAA